MEKIEFEFLKDAPISENNGDLFGFYHSNIAPALRDILESQTCVHTIALYGDWGTGKSTIVKLVKQDSDSNTLIIEFDCWKYEKDSLRRQLLMQLAKDLGLGKKYLDKLEKEFYFSLSEKVSEKLEVSWPRLGKAALFSLPFAIVPAMYAWQNHAMGVSQWQSFFSSLIPYWTALGLLLDKFVGEDFKNIIMISPVSGSKNRLDSPELFEKSFTDIIQQANGHQKIVIVIDNLDRVDPDIAREMLSTLKTFLEVDSANLANKSIVFLVPCDFTAIQKVNTEGSSDEFLRKIFNVTLWTPEFINSDLQSFTEGELKKTGGISQYLNNEYIALVINSAFANNPRQIKQFINNLIAAVITASKTDVWEIIQKNVPYLAKILVLRQKFPKAYARLKEKWFDPHNIIEEGEEHAELREFMLKTSPITVLDAEPYLYFKKPVISAILTHSDDIRIGLIEGNKEQSSILITQESNKEAVADFVSLLLSKYQSQPEVLLNILVTHLEIFNASKIKINKKAYYNSLGKAIDNNLWQDYLKLPTKLIFTDLLANEQIDQDLAKRIIERYITALSSDELKPPQNLDKAKEIITCLKEHHALLSQDNKSKIAQALEQNFTTYIEIMTLLHDTQMQNIFITKEGFTKFIATLEQKNIAACLPIILRFQKYITTHSGLLSVVIQRVVDLLQAEFTANPDTRKEKYDLMRRITELLSTFQGELTSLSAELKEQLVLNLTQTVDGISSPTERWICVESLQLVYPIATPEKQAQIVTLTGNFFANASYVDIENAIDNVDVSYNERLIEQFLPQLLPRMVSMPDLLEFIYRNANLNQKVTIIKHLIDNQNDSGVSFLSSLEKIPARVDIIKYLLNRLPAIQTQNRVDAYNFLPKKINKNDPEEIKNAVVAQIKDMLKTNDPTISKVGYDFFIHCEFLSDEKRREITSEVLAFLRDPGTTIEAVHLYNLSAISYCYEKLHDTVKKDFTHTLFDNLRPEKDKATLENLVEVIGEIKLTYLPNKTDFDDLLDRLNAWPESADKQWLLNQINALQPQLPTKEEKKYWKSITDLIQPVAG